MKHLKIFAALCCAAAVLAACDQKNEPVNTGQNDNPDNPPVENPDTVPAENPDTLVTAEYTLTVLSDDALGTVTGSGKYAAGTAVKVSAMPKQGYALASWSDTDAMDIERTITLTSDSTIVAFFRPATGTADGHEWVDLGLPSGLKWATCNVGATTPEAYGDYFAWGETTPKEDYSWETYKHGTYNYDGDYSKLTKYNTTDGKTTLEAADDAASVNWGGAWRMPTDAEWTELRKQCDWTWTTLNGVNGYEVKSNANGSSIFLPAAGYRDVGYLYRAGVNGDYWSSSLYTDYPNYAWGVGFDSNDVYRYGNRFYGQSVRPVLP